MWRHDHAHVRGAQAALLEEDQFEIYSDDTTLIARPCGENTIVEFLSYVNLHFHFTLMQKFKFWYQLEDNSIRSNFGPSVQRAFHMGGQGAPLGA